MARSKERQRWKCNVCNTVTVETDLLTAPSPFDGAYKLVACPRCKQCDEGFDLLCDEPGCHRHAGCGWPTGDDRDQWGGYRNTCIVHWGDSIQMLKTNEANNGHS